MNIYQKMSAITMEVATVGKNLNVGTGKSSYKAVGEADILAAVKPIEADHGVYSYPFKRTVIDSGEMVNSYEYNGKVTDKKQLYLRIETIYRFVNIDNPEEYIDITTYGDGVDSQDKAVGKAMTYADKYALMKAYKIQTGDDPDQKASEPLRDIKRDSVSANEVEYIRNLLKNDQNVKIICDRFHVARLEDLNKKQYVEAIKLYEAHKK